MYFNSCYAFVFLNLIDTFPFPMSFDPIVKVFHAGKGWVSLSFKLAIFNNFLEVKIKFLVNFGLLQIMTPLAKKETFEPEIPEWELKSGFRFIRS